MEAIHDVVGAVLEHIAPAFAEERVPPAALAELKELWLGKMDAAGMFSASPSPFPPLSTLTERDRGVSRQHARRAVKQPAQPAPLLLRAPSLPSLPDTRLVPIDSLAPGDCLLAAARQDELEADFGRPKSARTAPQTRSAPHGPQPSLGTGSAPPPGPRATRAIRGRSRQDVAPDFEVLPADTLAQTAAQEGAPQQARPAAAVVVSGGDGADSGVVAAAVLPRSPAPRSAPPLGVGGSGLGEHAPASSPLGSAPLGPCEPSRSEAAASAPAALMGGERAVCGGYATVGYRGAYEDFEDEEIPDEESD